MNIKTVDIENPINNYWSQDDVWEQTAPAEEAGIIQSIVILTTYSQQCLQYSLQHEA